MKLNQWILTTASLLTLHSSGFAQTVSDIELYTEPQWMGQTVSNRSNVKLGAVCKEKSPDGTVNSTSGCAIWNYYRWNGSRASQVGYDISIRSLPPALSLRDTFKTYCGKKRAQILVDAINKAGANHGIGNSEYNKLIYCIQLIDKKFMDPAVLLAYQTAIGQDGMTARERDLIEMDDSSLYYEFREKEDDHLNVCNAHALVSPTAVLQIAGFDVNGAGFMDSNAVIGTINDSIESFYKKISYQLRSLIRSGKCRPFGKIDPVKPYYLPHLMRAGIDGQFSNCKIEMTPKDDVNLTEDEYKIVKDSKTVATGKLNAIAEQFRDEYVKTGVCKLAGGVK